MKQAILSFTGALLVLMLLLVGCQQTPDTPSETISPSETTTESIRTEPSETQAAAGTVAETVAETVGETTVEATEEETTEAETEQQELTINAEQLGRILVQYYKTDGPASDSVYKSAESFRKLIMNKTGLSVKVTRVRNTSSNEAITFLIGDTPYPETAEVKETLPENSYAVRLMGRRIVIVGSNEALTVKALKDFCDQVLNNPELTKEGSITIRPEDGFTVTLDKPYSVVDMVADGMTVTADYTEILHAKKEGQYSISQGAASDGTYAYIALRNSDDSGAVIVKYRLDDGSFVAKSPVLKLGHANDMTYNTAKNVLVVAHGQKQGKILTLVNPETLEFIEDVNIEKGAGAITYNPTTDSYAISQGGKSLHMLDKDLQYVTSYERTKLDGYTAQGMGSDESYIYFPMSGSGQNILDTFDWNGNRVTQIILPTPHESESLFYVNGRHFVSFNYNGGTVYEIFVRCILPYTQ